MIASALDRMGRLALLALVMMVSVTGCQRSQPRILVPVQDSAREQFHYANWYHNNAHLVLITERDRLLEERWKIREQYQAVIDNFPEDRQFTPLAKLMVIEFDAGLDSDRAPYDSRRMRIGVQRLQELIETYPENDFIQAKARYDMANLYKREGMFEQAAELFRNIKEKYVGHPNREIQELADRAAYFYNQTYTQN